MTEELEVSDKMEQSKPEFTIGGYLKHKREIAGKSLETLSLKTKINTSMLETLEKDDFENLPNKAYVRGYVKSYIKELSLNFDETMNILDWTYHSLEKPTTPPKQDRLNKQAVLNSTNISIALILIAAIFTFIFYSVKNDAPEESNSSMTQTSNLETNLQVSQDNTIETERNESQTQTTQVVVPPVSTPIAVTTTVPTPKPIIKEVKQETKPEKKDPPKEEDKIKFYAAKSPLFSIFDQSKQEENASYLPNKYKSLSSDASERVYISAVDGPTWLTFKKDDEPIKKVLLDKGQTLFIAGEEIRIFFGNVNVTKVFYNNKLIDPSSKSGVKSMIFPISKQKEFKLPLFVFNKDKSQVLTSDEYLKQYPEEDTN